MDLEEADRDTRVHLAQWAAFRDTTTDASTARLNVPLTSLGGIADSIDAEIAGSYYKKSCSPDLLTEIVEEAEKDTALSMTSGSYNVCGFAAHLLSFILPDTDVPVDLRERLTRLALGRHKGALNSLLVKAVVEMPWFTWPGYASVQTCLLVGVGGDYLSTLRVTCDTETWDALTPSWLGSVEDLVEACALTRR